MNVSGSWAIATGLVCCVAAASPDAAERCDSLSAATGLLGSWEARDEGKTFTENWIRLSDTTFEGKGETRRNDKVIDGESLRLVQMGESVFYIAKVAHNALPVAFQLTQCSAQRLVFENPGHDFPRKLEYELRATDEMTARVSDGKDKGFTLTYRRR